MFSLTMIPMNDARVNT